MATMGRPRAFDLNDALDRAIEVFWRNGYEGASVAELCDAMGIRPPSLYAAFENKAGLFRHVGGQGADMRNTDAEIGRGIAIAPRLGRLEELWEALTECPHLSHEEEPHTPV